MTKTTTPATGDFISWAIWGNQTATAKVQFAPVQEWNSWHIRSADGHVEYFERLPRGWYPATGDEQASYSQRSL